jgi:protein-S-isoprenylcysteine O-methyltransferase Ste14
LGGAFVLPGVAFSRESPALLPAGCLYVPVTNATVVHGEEKRMERDFGGEYLEYKRHVPR